jgi:hypothetical protein
VSAELSYLGAAFGKRVRGFASLFEFGAVVGGDAVYYYEADVEALDRYWDLEAEDVLLGFEVVDMCALDPGQTGFLVGG